MHASELPQEERGRAAALRAARERAGLTVRELASRSGVSPATVVHVESGRDVRVGTLQALLEVLSDLDPAEILGEPGASEVEPPAASGGAWSLHRVAIGFEAASLERVATIRDDGDVVHAVEATGLRSDRGPVTDPAIRLSILRAIFTGATATLRRVDVAGLARAPRRFRIEEDDAVHELFVSAGASATATYRVRQLRRGVFRDVMADGEAVASRPTAVHGVSLAVTYPVHRLGIEVRFPRGRWPSVVAGYCWPRCVAPELGRGNLLTSVHPGRPFVADAERSRARLEVGRPLIELQYGVGWEGW